MKLSNISALAAAMIVCACSPDPESFTAADFKNPQTTYRAMPFWSLNDSLSTEGIRQQLEMFKDGGYGGAFLHSRLGLLTPYLNEEWFEMMDAGVKACQDLGLEAWFYDEDKWPSGFAGGIVPRQSEAFRAHTLARVPVGTKLDEGDKVLLVDGDKMYIDYVAKMGQPWYNGTCWVDLMNPDMVKAFIDCTYKPYVERYAGQKLVKGIFSDEPQVSPIAVSYPGTDLRFPYSPCMDSVFRATWGYDIKDTFKVLADTVGDWRTARLHYYRTVGLCMESAFSRQIGSYCAANNFPWTGHYNGEQMTSANMKNEGNLEIQLRNMQVPGVDALGLRYLNYHNDKVMTSVANQYGQKRRIIEIFGISGHNLSFEDRMWLTAWHTNMGANFMCPHLSLYSMKGERKRDYPPTLSYQQPYWSQNKLFEDFSARLCYFATVGATKGQVCVLSTLETDYLANGPQPIDYGSNTYDQNELIFEALERCHLNADQADEQIISEVGEATAQGFKVGEMTYSTVVLPHLLTIRPSTLKTLLEFGAAGGRIFVVKGYPKWVDGKADNQALEQLKGCSSLISDNLDSLVQTFSAIPNDFVIEGAESAKVMTHLREVSNGQTLQLSNTSRTETFSVDVRFNNIAENEIVALLNPVNGECLSVSPDSTGAFALSFAPAQSWVIFKGSKAMNKGRFDGSYSAAVCRETIATVPSAMAGRRLSPNALPLDFASYSTDGGKTWSEPEPLLAIYKRSGKEPYNGPMQLRITFQAEQVPAECALAVEQPWMYNSISLNGTALDKWGKDYFVDFIIRKHDITSLVKPGLNEILLSLEYKSPVGPSPDARERYGTEIETIYLVGEFGVKAAPAAEQLTTTWRNVSRKLAPKPLPTRFSLASLALTGEHSQMGGDITLEGYPFYAGAFELSTSFDMPAIEAGRKYFLSFPKVESTLVDVRLNGKSLPVVFCSPWEADITDAVKEGANELQIVLTGSLRNLMGPSHNVGGEFAQCGPSTFIGGNEWPNMILGDADWYVKRKNGTAKLWRDDYFCIPFGLMADLEILAE